MKKSLDTWATIEPVLGRYKIFFAVVIFLFFSTATAKAANLLEVSNPFLAEVIHVDGEVIAIHQGKKRLLEVGSIIKPKDIIEVSEASLVDIALDSDWENIIRLTANTKVHLVSLYPTGIYLIKGDITAKLDYLPEGDLFAVETPLGLAAVNGSWIRVMHGSIEGANHTRFYNVADSTLYAFRKEHQKVVEPKEIYEGYTVAIQGLGKKDRVIREMTAPEINQTLSHVIDVQTFIKHNYEINGIKRIQTIKEVESDLSKDVIFRLMALSMDEED